MAPAALDERLRSNAGICHQRLSAQAYLARCGERFHLISSTSALVRARHLFHNRSEVTLYLRKEAQSAVSTN